MLFVILFMFVAAQAQHTRIFEEFWDESGNENMRFFDPKTFGRDLVLNPCTRMRSSVFRDTINARVLCSAGLWCQGGRFACAKHGDNNCYHVEHIVESGQEFYSEDVQIAANYVMIWGRWNSAMGGLASRDPNATMSEKSLVMGKGVIYSTIEWIRRCKSDFEKQPEFAKQLEFVRQTQLYDPECDKDTCDCNSGSGCGCDCDFEFFLYDVMTPAYAIPVIVWLAGMLACAIAAIVYFMRESATKKYAYPHSERTIPLVGNIEVLAEYVPPGRS